MPSIVALKAEILYRDQVVAFIFDTFVGKGSGEVYLAAVRDADEEIERVLG
ncbi:hypothetical protein [Mycobacterium sp. IS-836]|uniref:hypothetical protein n=1 Tax=Mycobacterium sp. IS-836 TaxID=1834160 RepID=UPI00130128FC|nr:hypothetical protein [Mycobacterium sp. IS-836]